MTGDSNYTILNFYTVQLGCGIDHPPPSSTEVKGRVELYFCYLYSPSGLHGLLKYKCGGDGDSSNSSSSSSSRKQQEQNSLLMFQSNIILVTDFKLLILQSVRTQMTIT
jgi:hypothetical protein